EWIRMLEQSPGAKAAIESAKTWEVRDAKLRRELQAGLALELSLSCAAGRWDGEDPPAERGALCKVMNRQVTSFLGGSNPLANHCILLREGPIILYSVSPQISLRSMSARG